MLFAASFLVSPVCPEELRPVPFQGHSQRGSLTLRSSAPPCAVEFSSRMHLGARAVPASCRGWRQEQNHLLTCLLCLFCFLHPWKGLHSYSSPLLLARSVLRQLQAASSSGPLLLPLHAVPNSLGLCSESSALVAHPGPCSSPSGRLSVRLPAPAHPSLQAPS